MPHLRDITSNAGAQRQLHALNPLNLRIKIEERIQAQLQLRLDRLPAALQHMHRHLRLIAVLQLNGASPTDATSSAGSSRIP